MKLVCKIAVKALKVPNQLPGYLSTLRQLRSSKAVIFMYHGIAESPLEVPNWCFINVKEFEMQARFLADYYNVLPLEEVVERLQNHKPLPPRTACITFDDGFRSVATRAFPILDKYQLPATVFLVTGYVGTNQPAWPDRLFFNIVETAEKEFFFTDQKYPLNNPLEKAAAYSSVVTILKDFPKSQCDDELIRLHSTLGDLEVPVDSEMASLSWDEIEFHSKSSLFHFGAHTETHPILSSCSIEIQQKELANSRDKLRDRGLSYKLFAYPNGRSVDFTKETKGLLHKLGFSCGLSTINGLNGVGEDMYALKRVGVGPGVNGRDFEFLALGF